MKILVCGLPKSGTTALTYQIKDSISKDYQLLFEPTRFNNISEDNVLCKIIFSPFRQDFVHYLDFEDFDKKIQLIRDPRDILISSLLYFGAWFELSKLDNNALLSVIEKIKEKEKNPQAIALKDLFTLFNVEDFLTNFSHYLEISAQMNLIYDNLAILKYEDFIQNKINPVENFLGFNLRKDFKVDKKLNRVIRTKNSGNWRQWFTKEDVDYFKPIINSYLQRFDYDATDWDLVSTQIPSEYASDYILKVIKYKHKPVIKNENTQNCPNPIFQ